jgi:hypothetical protein
MESKKMHTMNNILKKRYNFVFVVEKRSVESKEELNSKRLKSVIVDNTQNLS